MKFGTWWDLVAPPDLFVDSPWGWGTRGVCNAITLALEYEYEGYKTGARLGVSSDARVESWNDATLRGDLFTIVSHIYNCIFIIELIIRCTVLRTGFFWMNGSIQKWAIFDCLIVFVTSVDLYAYNHPDKKRLFSTVN